MTDDPFARAIEHFNAEEYREALLAFEQRWVVERDDFVKALIQLSNALLQLRLGLVAGPRRTLASADALLVPYAPTHEGLDVSTVRDYIASVQACIPDGTGRSGESVAWKQVPRLQLRVSST